MKVELIQKEEAKKEIKYPCLMQCKDEGHEFIVFFISDSEGVVVGDCRDYDNGHYCDRWSMSDFTPYEGKVILQNDQYMPNNKIIVNKNKKNNYFYGKGVNDYNGIIYNPTNKNKIKSYQQWKSMLQRCYDIKYFGKYNTYKDCKVCEEWLLFSNFKKWHDNNYIDGYQLDKDIIIKGNKIYSPETCCFIPEELNKLFTKSNISRGNLPIGVCKKTKSNKYFSTVMINKNKKHLGSFKTIKEAFNTYKLAKETQIQKLANDYYKNGKIELNVYNAMMNYSVEITD